VFEDIASVITTEVDKGLGVEHLMVTEEKLL